MSNRKHLTCFANVDISIRSGKIFARDVVVCKATPDLVKDLRQHDVAASTKVIGLYHSYCLGQTRRK